MPGLIACNRRWDIGSDDLMFPAIVEMAFRGIWFVAILVIYSFHYDEFHCNTGYYFNIFYLSRVTFICIHVILDVLIIYIATRGTIMETSRRIHMPKVLYVKLAVFIPEFVLYGFGTYWTFNLTTDCPAYIVITAKVAVIGGWLFLFFLLIMVLVVFDPLGSQAKTDTLIHARTQSDTSQYHPNASAKKIWELRCRVLCCCTLDDDHSRNAFNDVALLMTHFFEGLDLVPTDIASGLLLVQYEQSNQPRTLMLEPLVHPTYAEQPQHSSAAANASITEQPLHLEGQAETSEVDNFPDPKPWMSIQQAAHYMKYAVAGYTWPLFIYMQPMTGCCQLIKDCRCCQCISSDGRILDDNCCQCHLAAIKKVTGCYSEDIIYASFYNRIYEIPFFVVLDHAKQSIVIAIRGTLSLRDALTDMTAECAELSVEELGNKCMLVHKGILQAAKFIQQTLEEKHILQQALEKGPGYRVIITGHSLGAGAASLLAIILRPVYPDLACFSFSPPGGLLCLTLSRYTERFICSVVVGMDIVPRLGILTMEDLKIRLLRCVRDSNMPKYKILAGGVTRAFCGCGSPVDDSAHSRHLLDGSHPRTHYTIEMPSNSDMERLEPPLVAGSAPSGAPIEAPVAEVPSSAMDDTNDCSPPEMSDINPGPQQSTSSDVVHEEAPDGQMDATDRIITKRAIDDAIVSANRSRMTHMCMPMYPPGQIIYIEETNPHRGLCAEAQYEAAWARADVFDEIQVSPAMLTDHLPDLVLKALQQLVERSCTPQQIVKKRERSPVPC